MQYPFWCSKFLHRRTLSHNRLHSHVSPIKLVAAAPTVAQKKKHPQTYTKCSYLSALAHISKWDGYWDSNRAQPMQLAIELKGPNVCMCAKLFQERDRISNNGSREHQRQHHRYRHRHHHHNIETTLTWIASLFFFNKFYDLGTLAFISSHLFSFHIFLVFSFIWKCLAWEKKSWDYQFQKVNRDKGKGYIGSKSKGKKRSSIFDNDDIWKMWLKFIWHVFDVADPPMRQREKNE